MAGWIRESRGGRSILLVLFALVLAIRVTIPTGFMPTAAPKGIVISVCTGLGETKAFLPTGDDDAPDPHGSGTSDCTFATGLGSGLVASVSAPLVAFGLAMHGVRADPAIAEFTVHRLAAPPPPAHAPPAHA